MPTEQEFKERTAYWDGYRVGLKDGEERSRRTHRQNLIDYAKRAAVFVIAVNVVIGVLFKVFG